MFIRAAGALGFAMSIPFLSIYLHEDLGVPMTQVGLMLATAGIFGSSAASFGGALSDRLGRHKLLVTVLSARSISFLILAFLVWKHTPFHVFAVVYILSTVLGTSIFPLMDSIVADVTPVNKRAEAYGLLRVTANVGWAIGPALGGMIVLGGYHLMFLATALMLMTSALIAGFKVSETRKLKGPESEKPGFNVLLSDGRMIRFMLVCLLMYLVKGQLVATMSVHASVNVGLSKAQIGLLYFVNGGMVVTLQVFATRLIRRFNPLHMLVIGCIIYGLGFALVGRADSLITMLLAVIIITVAEIIEAPTATTIVSKLAPEGLTGMYMGGFNMVIHLGWTVGPLMGGFLLDRVSKPAHMWEAIGMVALLAAFGFFIINRMTPVLEKGNKSVV